MAEFVQANLEKMLTELEQLQRIQLLSNEEVKLVIKKRKKFEYKMQKREKQKNDILAYIKYESSLLNLIALRREQSQYMNKKNEIDHAIAKRINKLFRILEHRFAGDLMVWSSHMAFLKEMGWTESISKIYRRMLQVHPDKVNLWISAGRSELEGYESDKKVNNIENARTIFMEGLRFHPQAIDLVLESFRLELVFIERLKNDPENYIVPEENKDAILSGKVAEAICKNAVDAFGKSKDGRSSDENVVKLLIALLHAAKLLNAGYHLQTYLVKLMVENLSTEPLAWAGYASSALHRPVNDSTDQTDEDGYISSVERTAAYKIEEYCSRIEQGLLEKLPKEVPVKRQTLLDIYLESLLDILENTKDAKICEYLAKRIWCLLAYGKQDSILNERNNTMFQNIADHIEQ